MTWVESYGLVDGDDRTAEQLERLQATGVFGLRCYSVESLYYHPEMISRLAVRQAQVTGENDSDLKRDALAAVLSGVANHKDRMCARMVERKIRHEITKSLPDHKYIADNDTFSCDLDMRQYREQEHAKFDAFLTASDAGGLIARYPIRETGVLLEIASRLGFDGTDKFEMSVRKLLVDDEDARTALKVALGELAGVLDV